jgi:Predicted membrane protein (DUF2207)
VPVTVTVSRGNPLPWPVALVFTVVGAGLIVFGFLGPYGPLPGLDEPFAQGVLTFIALLLIVPTWVIFLVWLARRVGDRHDITGPVPDEVPEPPSAHDPSIVGVLIGDGKPPRRTVAGAVLALAARNVIAISEYGDKLVIEVPATATGATEGERLVVDALRERVDERGDVVGPPIWSGRARWFAAFARDARSRATAEGLLEARIPFIGLMLVFIFTATGLSLIFFSRIAVFVGLIILANGLPHLVFRASGFHLSDAGMSLRARWEAFGRYLHEQGSLRDVGPAGVVVWGPNLAYGAVLGEAARAARPLTPAGDDDTADDPTLGGPIAMEL